MRSPVLATFAVTLIAFPAVAQAQKTSVAEQDQKTSVAEQAQKTAVGEQDQKTSVAEQDQKTAVTVGQRPDEVSPYQSQTSVPTDRAREENQTLGDLVQRATGVTLQKNGTGAQPTYVAIRGANPRQMSVTWNGLQLRPPFGPGFDFGLFDPSLFDSVTVIRGGASAGRGNGALTGAVDLARRPPSKDTTQSMFGLRLQSFGTWDLLADSRINRDGQWGALSVTHLESHGRFPFVDRQGTEQIRLGNDVATTQVSGAFGGDLTDRWRARGDLLFIDRRGGAAGPSEFQSAFENARTTHEQVAATAELTGDGLKGLGNTENDTSVALGVSRSESTYDNENALLGGGSFSNDIANVGVNLRLRNAIYTDTNLLSSMVLVRFDELEQRGGASIDAQRSSVQVSLGDEFFWRHGVLAAFVSGAVVSDRDSQWSANATATFQPVTLVSFALNVARSYRVPDLDELFLRGESVRGNPDLNDESAWTGDLAAKFGDEDAALTLTGFANQIESTILFLPVSAYLFEAQNVESFLAWGGELSADARLGPAEARAWYTLTISEIEAGVQSPQQPKHQGGVRLVLGTETGWPTLDRARAFAEVTGRSETNLDRFGSLRSEGYVVLNGGLSVSFFERVDLSFAVRNILDNRTRENVLQRPLPGRVVSAGITGRF